MYGGVVPTIDDTGDLPWIGPSPYSTLLYPNAIPLPTSPRKQDRCVLLLSLQKNQPPPGISLERFSILFRPAAGSLVSCFPTFCHTAIAETRTALQCQCRKVYNASIEALHGFKFSTSQTSARDFDLRSLDGLIESCAKLRG